jgi:hypothetical protein
MKADPAAMGPEEWAHMALAERELVPVRRCVTSGRPFRDPG